jgi:hypothetical protein
VSRRPRPDPEITKALGPLVQWRRGRRQTRPDLRQNNRKLRPPSSAAAVLGGVSQREPSPPCGPSQPTTTSRQPFGLLDALPLPTFNDSFVAEIFRILDTFQSSRNPILLLSLIGVGGGRTPAGDDILLGILAGLSLIAGRAALACRARLSRALRPRLRDGTTSLSATLLNAALDDTYPAPIAELLDIATSPSACEHEIETAASRVASFGHSSGQAFLLGLRTALLALRCDGGVRHCPDPGTVL